MALAISICEKVWPAKNNMGYHVVITDNDRPDLGVGAQVVIDTVKTVNVAAGEPPTADQRDKVMGEIQAIINQYKTERTQYDIPAYETSASYVASNLNLG